MPTTRDPDLIRVLSVVSDQGLAAVEVDRGLKGSAEDEDQSLAMLRDRD